MASHCVTPPPSPPSSRRPLLSLTHVARSAALLLLVTWFGPVSFEQAVPLLHGGASPAVAAVGSIADASVVPAGEALVLAPGTPIELHLRSGRVLRGRFLGRALQDSAAYAERFAASASSAEDGALSLGDSLRVVTLDGRVTTAAFAGWAEMALLLRGPADAPVLHVPFEFADSLMRADGSLVDLELLKHAFRNGDLPSADVLVLGASDPVGTDEERWASALRVPAEDIESVRAPSAAGKGVPGVLVLAVGVTAFVLIIIATRNERRASSPSCEQWDPMTGWSAYRRIERPFDLGRGRFVDDPVARAEAWSEAPPLAER